MKLLFSVFLSGLFFLPAMGQGKILKGEIDSVSYSLGIMMGSSIQKAGIMEFNDKMFVQGIHDIIGGQQPVLSMEQANILLNNFITSLNTKKAAANLLEGQKFLAENAKKEGVITLPSGLQYKVIKEGEGLSPVDTSFVTVHYTGTYLNGVVFDSSVERGEPAEFGVNAVIPGWTEALKLMKPGANWILYVPSNLAYGENSPAGVEPNSMMIFDVQLLSVK